MSDHQDVAILKRELLGLFQHIQKIRKEIASIRRPGQPDKDHFSKMSDELDAIVSATAGATDTILETVEEMEDLIDKIRPMVANAEGRALLDTFPEKSGQIFEACAFQDITGQRITKVVNSLQYVEERVNALISIWGENQIASEATEDGNKPVDEYKQYLNGPQLAGEGVSQADVDAMFSDKPAKPGLPTQPPAQTPPQQKAAPPKPAQAAPPQKPAPAKPAAPPQPQPKPPAKPQQAAKPAPKPEPKPAPKPEPKKDEGGDDSGSTFSQDDIDKLFG
ncbi:Chemotaxis protein [Caenispirillum salinarum AK4]|uniref:Chemotaxis protein n=1 Tax=Caenispirillum salinarum AK4 TaxID=1238182 RepID=K9GRP6_9PROT|nr:protein phosphatase CheZ [Caenispirillum salinarum]EKV28615.1 Chemotaxis protein [Caenispirillum salinarum AK4]